MGELSTDAEAALRNRAEKMWADAIGKATSEIVRMLNVRRVVSVDDDTIDVEGDDGEPVTIIRSPDLAAADGDLVLSLVVANREYAIARVSGEEALAKIEIQQYAVPIWEPTNQLNFDGSGWTVFKSPYGPAITVLLDIAYLQELIRDTIAAALVAGSGISKTVDDAGNTITITNTGGGGGGGTVTIEDSLVAIAAASILNFNHVYYVATDAGGGRVNVSFNDASLQANVNEYARDAIGAALTAGSGVAITPDDAANTITVAVAYGGSGGNFGTSSNVARSDHVHAGVYQPVHARLTDISAGADPVADRILFFDASGSIITWLQLGTNLSITGTTLNATGGGASYPVSDATFELSDDADPTKRVKFNLAPLSAGNAATVNMPAFTGNGTLVATSIAQTLTNKTLDNTNIVTLLDINFTLQDDADPTKIAQFQLSGIATGTTRTYTLPDGSGTLVLTTLAQSLQNKTLVGNTIGSTNSVSSMPPFTTMADDEYVLVTDNNPYIGKMSWPDFKKELATSSTGWQVNKRLAATVNSTIATAADVTGMSFTVVAGEMWTFDFMIFTGCSGTGGCRYALNFAGAGYEMTAEQFGAGASLTAFVAARIDTANTLSTAVNTVASQTGFVRITGSVYLPLAAGGSQVLQLRHAAGTAGQTASTRIGSTLVAHRVA